MKFAIKKAASEQEFMGKAYVHYASWKESYTGLMPQEFLDQNNLEKCRKTACAFPQNTLVAVVEDTVVGFACFLPESREFVSIRPSSEVTALYVLEDFQKNGIGSALLEECLKNIPSGPVVLFVLNGNEKALRFYRAKGFDFTGKKLEQEVSGGKLVELEMVLEREQR